MPMPYKGGNRKRFQVAERGVEALRRLAEKQGRSLSSIAAGWLKDYGDGKGPKPETDGPVVELQIIADPEIIQRAAARAKAEGVELRDVINAQLKRITPKK